MDDRTRLSLEDLGRMTPCPGDNGEHERKRQQLVGRVFWTRSRKETFAAWLFIFPDCIGLLVFVAIPMVLALSLGFFSVDGFGGYKFAGLANYNRMLRDPLFMKSLGVTTVYVLCLVPGLYVSGPGTSAACAAKDPVGRTLADFIFHAVRCEPLCRCIDLEGDADRQSRLHQSDVRTCRPPGPLQAR